MKLKNKLIIGSIVLLMLSGCRSKEVLDNNVSKHEVSSINEGIKTDQDSIPEQQKAEEDKPKQSQKSESSETKGDPNNSSQTTISNFTGYTLIEVDGGNRNGTRKANVVVDIGFGDREYWAFTNAYGQLVRVIADRITIQDPVNEKVNSDGRYYDDEAYVPGVESEDFDQGHIIADSLGGVANAYNITPQNSTLNRHGDQAYMEKVMRQAGGSTNFEAIITYPNTITQIPSNYKYTYYLNGNKVVISFDNKNPEAALETKPTTPPISNQNTDSNQVNQASETELVNKMDTNKNGQISIKEAKAAGHKMPIHSNHWLYKFMTDGDGDGMVGE